MSQFCVIMWQIYFKIYFHLSHIILTLSLGRCDQVSSVKMKKISYITVVGYSTLYLLKWNRFSLNSFQNSLPLSHDWEKCKTKFSSSPINSLSYSTLFIRSDFVLLYLFASRLNFCTKRSFWPSSLAHVPSWIYTSSIATLQYFFVIFDGVSEVFDGRRR